MNKNMESEAFREKAMKGQEVVDELIVDKQATEEEFQNFMHRVTEIEKIIKQLASSNPEEQKCGQILADEILDKNCEQDFSEVGELTVKTNRTLISKYSPKDNNSDETSQEVFMKSVEKDAKERAENRKIRNERAETLKRIGIGAFREGNYEKAVTYFSKAIEHRKDSSQLWNNRALAYINLELFEKAIHDCEWALKVNDSNLKALLNIAKCYIHLENKEKYEEFIQLARERNPNFNKFIDEFAEKMKTESGLCGE